MRGAIYNPHTDEIANVRRCSTPDRSQCPEANVASLSKKTFNVLHRLGVEVTNNQQPRQVVIGFPGPVSPAGYALAAPTMWGDCCHERIDIVSLARQYWPDSGICVINDVTAAGYRYMINGNDSFSIITVSSGIGNKLFIDGKAIVGPNGIGGELGHICIDYGPDAPICECGGKGHLAAFASGRASRHQASALAEGMPSHYSTSNLAQELNWDISRLKNEILLRHFYEGDYWAGKIVEAMARPIGQIIAIQHLETGIERFILVGGFALAAGQGYLEMVAESAAHSGWRHSGNFFQMIELGIADDDAGLIGAGRYAVAMRNRRGDTI